MRRSLPIAVLAVVVAAVAIAAFLGGRDPDGFSFERRAGRMLITGDGIPALRATGVVIAGGRHGADVIGVPDATPPNGMTTQIMKFRFRSHGFFTAEPGAHFAIGVTGAWRKDDPATPDKDGLLVGRGVVIGNVKAATGGCDQAPVVEIESFRRNGNALFADSCSRPLTDDAWYGLTLTATRGGAIAYVLTDADNKVIGAARVDDGAADIPTGQGGWWLLHVFADRHPERDFKVDIADFEVAWLATDPTAGSR